MIWVVFAAMVLATLAMMLLPLLRSSLAQAPQRIDYDIVVYRDQLAEIDQEIERGQLTQAQADAARAEIHRRMLATEDAEFALPVKHGLTDERYSRFVVVVLMAVLIPVGAAILYKSLGSPNLPGKPFEWRLEHDPEFATTSTAEKLAQMLANNPSADGYKSLAEMYFSARDYEKAAAADRKAISLGSNDASTWSELGEAVVLNNGGTVVPEALMAFINALNADGRSERARFYIGLAEAQIGNFRLAVAIWRDLEKGSDPGAPWLAMLREHINIYSKQGGFAPETVPPSPPDTEGLKGAIAAMTSANPAPPGATAPVEAPAGETVPVEPPAATGDRDTMIRAMVARLAAKIETNPTDIKGWKLLAHSYVVLGDNARARAAIDRAVKQKPNDVTVLLALAEVQRASAGPDNNTSDDFIATLRKVLKLEPGNVQALYYVGLAEQKAGKQDVAVAMWKKAVSLATPDEPLTIAIRNRLDDITKKKTAH